MRPDKTTLTISILCLTVIAALLWGRGWLFRSAPHESVTPGSGEKETQTDSVLQVPATDHPLQVLAYEWPPFNIRGANRQYSGADVEISLAVLNAMGYEAEVIDMPFKRILEEMRTGTYPAMLPCVTGGGREDYLLFSDPVSSIYSVLWKKKGDRFTWQRYEDLNGRTVGASHYHYGAGFLEAGRAGVFRLDMVASDAPELIHFRKLVEGKTDMFICELSVGLYIQHQYRPEFDGVDYCPKGVGPVRPFCFSVSRKYFSERGLDAALFISRFNKELSRLARQGYLKQVFNSYHMLVATDEHGAVVLTKEGFR